MISILMLLLLLYIGFSYSKILLLTIVPLIISTLLLLPTKGIKHPKKQAKLASPKKMSKTLAASKNTYSGIIVATALYGFSTYSLGFPILTIAQQTSSSILWIGSYAIYLGVSSIIGYWIGSRNYNKVKALSYLGYILSGLGSLMLGLSYLYGLGYFASYFAVAILGFAFGVIETLEPTLISFIKNIRELGRGMGALSGSRSLGIFLANLIMGVLYIVNPFYSYLYAAIISVVAGMVVLIMGRDFRS